MTDLNLDGRFTVASMPGVAFWLKGYGKEWTQESWELACSNPAHKYDFLDESDPEAHDQICYLYNESEEVDNTEFVIAVMVGDDREHIVGVDELTEISEDGYCPGCGQTGCHAYERGD